MRKDDRTEAAAGRGERADRTSDEIRVQRAERDDRNSREIQRDLHRTRSDLDDTVDAIEKKLTPGQLLGEAWSAVRSRSGGEDGPGIAKRMIREHPFPSALVGLGLGWMAVETLSGSSEDEYDERYEAGGPPPGRRGRRSRSGARGYRPGAAGYGREARAGYPGRYEAYRDEHEDEGMMDKVKDKARDASEWASEKKDQLSGMTDRASESTSGMKDRASHAADDMKHRASEMSRDAREGMSHLAEEAGERAHQVREKAEEFGHTVQRQTRRARRGIRHQMEESPLSLGVATFAAGLLGGMSIPTTRWEDETMGETRDHLVHQAVETGRETMQDAKEVAVAAAEGAVHKMEEEKLTPSGLAESAREVAREAKESAKEKAEKEGLTGEGMKDRVSGEDKPSGGRKENPADRSPSSGKPSDESRSGERGRSQGKGGGGQGEGGQGGSRGRGGSS